MNQQINPEEVIKGFEKRVDDMFRKESGKPLKRAEKQKPLKPGRGNYVRGYSYSIVSFAARCIYLNEMIEEANAALVENAQHYIDNPKDINDRDSFHWHASEVMRLLEMYGPNGIKDPGLITAETESICLKPIFEYAKKFSKRSEYKKSKTWYVYESENHHAMSFTTCWQFAKIARNHPDYRTEKYGGMTAEQHYKAWNNYFVEYCRERARKGMFIEMMSGAYNSTLIKGIYNFYDFGELEVKKAAKLLLDLYFAYWAQEQIDAISGGGKSRVYFKNGLRNSPTHKLGWYYFGIGKVPHLNGHDLNVVLSTYRPPAVVADIALDVKGRGRYEVKQFPRGLGKSGNRNPYRMKVEEGGIQRYTYCSPSFIIGTPMVPPRSNEDWAAISSQNRWQGVIFSGNKPSRIVPIPQPKDNLVAFNAFWSVQSKGTMITQKLKHNKSGVEMIIYISKEGLSEPVTEEGIVFVEAEKAYAAVRVMKGGFKWEKESFNTKKTLPDNNSMILNDKYAPVILEVMSKKDVENFDAFKKKVKACKAIIDGNQLTYQSIYGDTFTFDTDYKEVPTINGKKIQYKGKKVFGSPFLNSKYNSGIVTITKGDRKLILDFNEKSGEKSEKSQLKIGLIGDSTVAVQSGWGPAFAERFNKNAEVINYAKNGATLESLSKRLDELLELKPDYVLVQFGHNDQKRYDTEIYKDKLNSYIKRIQKAGSKPVIVSSVVRRSFDKDGKIVCNLVKSERFTFKGTLTEYALASKMAADENNLSFIDLHVISMEHHNKIGREESMTYNFKEGDKTHFNKKGGKAIAGIVIDELKKVIPELKEYIEN